MQRQLQKRDQRETRDEGSRGRFWLDRQGGHRERRGCCGRRHWQRPGGVNPAARAGTKVLVADLDLRFAERTVEMIQAEGGTAAAQSGDITNESDCKRLVDAAVDRWGRLDFLDNNVGIGSRGSVVDEKPEEYRRVMQINV